MNSIDKKVNKIIEEKSEENCFKRRSLKVFNDRFETMTLTTEMKIVNKKVKTECYPRTKMFSTQCLVYGLERDRLRV